MIKEIIQKELNRQNLEVELIASENYASKEVRACQGSVMTNKYAEGYPGRRYYGGCEHVDEVENIAIETAKKIFNVGFANVQPHSGSQANMAAYRVLMKGRENTRILAMNLQDGGHLTHGHRMSFSGQDYNFVSYGVDDVGLIDYMAIQRLVNEYRPTLIVAGASAYSRAIDFKRFRQIADTVGAYLMVDMAHIAGLVAAGLHQNPCEYADIVTTTTHKTLRGPRGGMILTNNAELAKQINSSVFPGVQGGPLMHVIAAKAQCFLEADTEEFKTYQANVIRNTAAMAEFFKKAGYKVIADGTDNHLFLLDTKTSFGITGKKAEEMLSEWGIIVNKNTIPNDTEKPFITSGIRIGCAAITTRGANVDEAEVIASLIMEILKGKIEEGSGLYQLYKDLLTGVVGRWTKVEDI